MNVADVTTAGIIRASSMMQTSLEIGIMDITDRLPDEVTSSDVSNMVNRDDIGTASTETAFAGMWIRIERKERINVRQKRDFFRFVIIGLVFIGVDPHVYVFGQQLTQCHDLVEVFMQPHHTHTILDAISESWRHCAINASLVVWPGW